ncbi:integrator complex subunit 7 homolog [Microplitis mediator]|uniref:integrator complex subunit 7 homolog n=1 Tax=Microplitis mediator TaxID=375433 RepID=UPI002554D682|nr:integrator complex subunit 7 homolog [Microplitis mediator]
MSQVIRLQFYDINGDSVHDQVLNLYDYLNKLKSVENDKGDDVINNNNNNNNNNNDNDNNNNIKLFVATQLSKETEEQLTYNRPTDFNVDQLFPLSVGSFLLVNDKELPNIQTIHIIAYENKYLRYYSTSYLGYILNIILDLFHSLDDINIHMIGEYISTLEIYLKNKYRAIDAYLPVSMRLIETSNLIKCFDKDKYSVRLV